MKNFINMISKFFRNTKKEKKTLEKTWLQADLGYVERMLSQTPEDTTEHIMWNNRRDALIEELKVFNNN